MVQGIFSSAECEFTRLLSILQQLSLSAVTHHFQNGARYPQEDCAQEDIVECLYALNLHPSLPAHRTPFAYKSKSVRLVLQVIGQF